MWDQPLGQVPLRAWGFSGRGQESLVEGLGASSRSWEDREGYWGFGYAAIQSWGRVSQRIFRLRLSLTPSQSPPPLSRPHSCCAQGPHTSSSSSTPTPSLAMGRSCTRRLSTACPAARGPRCTPSACRPTSCGILTRTPSTRSACCSRALETVALAALGRPSSAAPSAQVGASWYDSSLGTPGYGFRAMQGWTKGAHYKR